MEQRPLSRDFRRRTRPRQRLPPGQRGSRLAAASTGERRSRAKRGEAAPRYAEEGAAPGKAGGGAFFGVIGTIAQQFGNDEKQRPTLLR